MNIQIIATGSSGNCYRIADGKTSLLLDAGIESSKISKATGYKLAEIAGVLITHEHGDHISGIKPLIRKYGIKAYMSEGTYTGTKDKTWELDSPQGITFIKARETFKIGTFTVLPFDVEHDANEPLGFLICSQETGEKLLYFTDTYYLKYTFRGVTHLMAECNYTAEALRENEETGAINKTHADRVRKSHMSLETLKGVLEAMDRSQLQQIYLIHTSNNNGDKERMTREIRELTGVEVYTK